METSGYMEELTLKRRIRDEKSKEEKMKFRKELVALYVRQAEHFKLSDRPDFKVARQILEKAIELQVDHPLANYRLGYIHYRDGRYASAVHHFNIALGRKTTNSLSEVQITLAHMFSANCGIHIAREALFKIEGLENVFEPIDDEGAEKIKRYRDELLVQEWEMFDRLYYRKIRNGEDKIITETEFHDYSPAPRELVLKSSEEGRYALIHLEMPLELNMTFFNLLFLLSTRSQSTYQSLQTQLTELNGEEISNDNLRQSISRLKKKIISFDTLFNTISTTDKEGSRINVFELSDEWTVTILCRADDFLKNEI
ncbi:tetratricopeptide repeat protein [Exiguobacterium sp. SL-9]|uniref:tetratricopeptide repeat protein n=1 Tax=Exiguobacterium sp. SL-9 TaxID=2510963 RepID=UPI00103B4896|nr:tetratricopeptide repeat protein [Exiguobacterium sp. SL-9]TCI20435.1 tetratricopeptide repeat protein [Exiguobacterium sp. SL-9]